MIPGICGIVRFDSAPVAGEPFAHMQRHLGNGAPVRTLTGGGYALAQAGYDSTGYEGECLASRDGVTLAFEGRITNRRDLLRKLRLASGSSYAQLLLAGYARWQDGLLGQLLGPFTLAIFDEARGGLLLATDPLGLRPLYYHRAAGQVVFGSDVRQVLAGAGLESRLEMAKVMEFLSPGYVVDEGWTYPETTFFRGVQLLPYASCLWLSRDGRAYQRRYWHPPQKLSRKWSSAADWAAEFRALFEQVVGEHLETTYPLGCELSGGIDSGALACVAWDILERCGRGDHPFHSYTLTYNCRSLGGEMDKVRSVWARHPAIRGHVLEADHLCGPLEGGPWQAFRPFAHPCRLNIPESFVALAQDAAGDGCKLLLSGEGADWYLEGTDVIWDSAVRAGNWPLVRRAVRALLARGSWRLVARYLGRFALQPLLPRWLSARAFVREYYEATWKGRLPAFFTPAFRGDMRRFLREQCRAFLRRDPLECWSQRLEFELLFPPNHGWQSLPIDVELCLPYLDWRLVAFGLTVPPEYKFSYSPGTTSHYGARKVLQRWGLKGLVPPEVLESQVKATYGWPVARRMQQSLLAALETSAPVQVADLGIVDMDRLLPLARRVAADPRLAGDHPGIEWLDAILQLEMWLRSAFGGPAAPRTGQAAKCCRTQSP
jgi:asparagine synthase (glutamine-hydrolysing)